MSGRAILRLIAATLLLAICLPLWAIARPFGGHRAWVRRFLAGIGWLLGLRVTTQGKPVKGPALLVANHISWLDILALGGATETCFIAKSEIEGWPVVGWLARLGGSIFVSRERRSETRDQADTVTHALQGDRTVALFAEGGTGDGHALLPFRAPLFVSAVEAGATVQPVAIDYGPDRARYAWPAGDGFGRAAKALINRRGRIQAVLKFLDPLDSHLLDRKQLALRSQRSISSALDPASM